MKKGWKTSDIHKDIQDTIRPSFTSVHTWVMEFKHDSENLKIDLCSEQLKTVTMLEIVEKLHDMLHERI